MAKTERLFALMQRIRAEGPVTIDHLIAEFGVSERTLYRDLRTLVKMNVPVYYDGGYRLKAGAILPSDSFTMDEIGLIRLSLRCNKKIKPAIIVIISKSGMRFFALVF